MTTVLINAQHPWLRIIDPGSGEVIQFTAGRLIVEDDHPHRDMIMSVAVADPAISIITVQTRCDVCGAVFTGGLAKANLAKHRKAEHPDAKPSSGVTELKKAANFACSICTPAQVFANEDDLVEHNSAVHMKKEEAGSSSDT